MSEKTSDSVKNKGSEFDKEVELCIKPITDYIQSVLKTLEERLRYAVIKDGLLRSVHVNYRIAKCWANDDNTEIWIAFVNKDNSVSMLAKTDFDWRAKQ